MNTIGLYMLVSYRPIPGWDRDVAKHLMSFGLPLAGSSLLLFAMLNADYLIVGRLSGTVALGLYTLAFNLSSWPSSILTGTMRRVSVPAFSALRSDPAKLERSFATGLRNLAVLTIPLTVGLAVLAVPLVAFLYPSRYRPAASALAFLAILGGIRVLLDFALRPFRGPREVTNPLVLQCLWGVVLIPALIIGADDRWHPGGCHRPRHRRLFGGHPRRTTS